MNWVEIGEGRLQRLHPDAEALVADDVRIEKVAGGFSFVEGPVWLADGGLAFSDIPRNLIYRWTAADGVKVWIHPSGHYGEAAGDTPPEQLGSNGLTLDAGGRLIVCEHGNRRLTRRNGPDEAEVLADHYEGKRLNSPNDVVLHRDGTIIFTDPPYGLAGKEEDPNRELDFSGVYSLSQGRLQPIYTQFKRPNGVAFNPSGTALYVGNSEAERRTWLRFPYRGGGDFGLPEVFADVTGENAPGNPDGLKVDSAGNVYCTGPGGIWIFSNTGNLLARLEFPELPANCHWGAEDARTLYVTARTSLYRVRLGIGGIRPLEWLKTPSP